MKNNKLVLKKSQIDYIAVLVAVLGMGSLYFQVLRMPLMAVMLLVVAGIYFIGHPTIRRENFTIFATLTVSFLLTSIVNIGNGFYINDLVIWLINVTFIIALQQNMSFNTFKNNYVRIMIVEAIISLLSFIIADQLGRSLPLMTVDHNSTNSFYLTPYFTRGWGNIPYFHRNAGWYTEPGAHQIFLNFALIFLISDDEHCGIKGRNYLISIIILVVTILTTLSTTGYMCLAVVLISEIVNNTSAKNRNLKIGAVVLLVVLIIIEEQTGVIEDKLTGISVGQGSGLTRLNDTIYGYNIALQRPITGHGMYMTNQRQLMNKFGINNISNGMASFSIRAGILITLGILVMVYKGFQKRFPYGFRFQICIFVLYLLCVNSEGLFLNLLFLAIIAPWKDDYRLE